MYPQGWFLPVTMQRSAKERRAQRARAEARLIGRILRGCLELAVHRGANSGDVLSSLADNFRGRSSAKQEHKEVGHQTDPDILVILVSAATQTEVTKPSAVESPAVPGMAPCFVADVMQTEDSGFLLCPSAF